MKVIAINGSPRSEGNTKKSLELIAKILREEGIDTEIVQLGGRLLHGCSACGGCAKMKNQKCSVTTDDMNDVLEKVYAADGLIIGSPTYFSNVTTETKAFIDRCGYVSRANGGLLKDKIGAPVVVARRAGSNFVYAALNFFFGIAQMPIASSNYWNVGFAGQAGNVLDDAEGVATFETLAKSMAKLMKCTNK